MIERGHRHVMYPVGAYPRPDGSLQVKLRCNASPATPGDPRPACSLEEERTFDPEGRPIGIRYRFGSLWFSALDLLRLLPLDVRECPACEGEPMLLPCERCNGLGVEEGSEAGGLLAAPNLHVRA